MAFTSPAAAGTRCPSNAHGLVDRGEGGIRSVNCNLVETRPDDVPDDGFHRQRHSPRYSLR